MHAPNWHVGFKQVESKFLGVVGTKINSVAQGFCLALHWEEVTLRDGMDPVSHL